MRPAITDGRWAAALIASVLMLLVGPAASASAAADVRFLNARPGAEPVQLHALAGGSIRRVGAPVRFGEVSPYRRVPAGSVELAVRASGGRALASGSGRLRDRARYTVIALAGPGDRIEVLRDGRPRPGRALIRVVHAAPELGRVAIRLGERRLAQVGFQDVAPYASVDPGSYRIAVTRPDNASALTARAGVPLTAGTSSTAFVLGSGGEPVSVVVAADRSAAPRGAPATGLGGLAGGDGSPFLLALLAGLLAAGAGGAVYLALAGRARGRGL